MQKSTISIREPQTRTLTKTVLFRILSVIAVYFISIGFGFTSQVALAIVGASIIAGTITYYLHDRAWNLVNWNRNDQFKETKLRSVIKTVVYRIIVFTITTVGMRSTVSNSNDAAASFALVQLVVNTCLYFITERVSSYIGRRQSHV